jgi:RNA recognition motif-containing protein
MSFPCNTDTGHSRGFGFITFETEDGSKAISEIMKQQHTINEKTGVCYQVTNHPERMGTGGRITLVRTGEKRDL